MVKFIGTYRAKIDDKGRLIFPHSFKALMASEESKQLVVKKDMFAECLLMYTYAEWEKESESVKSRLNFFKKEHNIFWREYMRERAIVEPDEKLGRITIPKNLLDNISAEKEVVFCGSDHKIEIWALEKYEIQAISNEQFIDLAEKILG